MHCLIKNNTDQEGYGNRIVKKKIPILINDKSKMEKRQS